MFEAIRSFVADLANGDKQGSDFDDDDHRVAYAALLVHAASIDGNFSKAERDKLDALLKQRFDLHDAEAGWLIEQATVADQEAVDLYRFTRLLDRALDENQRLRMIEMMWEVAYSDGRITEFENNLIWRVADLLGVASRERIALRQRVKAARGSALA
ncbi:MAG: TerB family tellurite resistance protein [Xanthobacteraceae bacterium]